MRLWISASSTSELPSLTSAALSSLTEILPLPSLSSTLKALSYDMLGVMPDFFEKPNPLRKTDAAAPNEDIWLTAASLRRPSSSSSSSSCPSAAAVVACVKTSVQL